MNGQKPEIHIMLDFMAAQARLPKQVQSKTAKLILQLKSDPSSKGVNWESIEGARDRHMKSARVDVSYRAIVYERSNALILLWVDKHDDAYRWAKNRVVEINPMTASVQISDLGLVEAPPAAPPPARTAAPSPAAAAALYAQVSDADLVKLGVPDALLPAVRALTTEADLDAAKDGFPVEAYDALILLGAGYSVEETEAELERGKPTPVTEKDFAAALKTDESRRTFWLVEDDEELRRMLDEPLEFWRVFLHPSQRKLVQRTWNGAVLVRGGAGTGKTVVAMHRARWLADSLNKCNDANGKVLFTTFTSNLAADVQANLSNLCSKEQFSRIEVQHLDGWVVDFMRKSGYTREILYADDDPRRNEAWDYALDNFGHGIGLSPDFLKDEWRQVVQANGVSQLPEYLRVQRVGRGTPIDRKTKEKVWAVFAAYRSKLDQEGLSEPEDAYRHAREILKAKPTLLPYRAVVVDEAQDLGAEAFRLIAAIAPTSDGKTAQDGLFIVGDAHQRIYGRKASMSKCGIDVRGRSRKLKTCYRTSDEIRRWAVSILHGVAVDDLDDGMDDLKGYRSLFHGPAPTIVFGKTAREEFDSLKEWIEECKDEGVEENEICVLARRNEDVNDVANLLKNAGYEVVTLQRQKADDPGKPGVRVCTMHRSKGLEFVAVALVRINRDTVPPRWLVEKAPDPAIRRSIVDGEKSLVHVSATRAKKHLFVGSSGAASELIAHLEEMAPA